MSNELVILGQTPQAGNFNFKSRFSKVKPGTITIVQPTSLNGTKGNLRIAETGEEFKSLRVALLMEPKEQRQFHIGDGEMNRIPENLMCFTRDVIRNPKDIRKEMQGPDLRSKVPQAPLCTTCANSDWSKYMQTKSKEDIPPCDLYFYATLGAVDYPSLHFQLYVRSKSKQPFEKGMEELTRKLVSKFDKDGLIPNYYDVTFTLGTKAIQNERKQTSYILSLSDFDLSTPEEQEAFAGVYSNLVAFREEDTQTATEKIAESQSAVDSLVTEAEYVDDKPITI